MSFARCKDMIVFIIILSFSDLQLAFYTAIRLGELHKARLCCPINLCFNVFCCLGASKRTSVNRDAHFDLVEFCLLITCILYFLQLEENFLQRVDSLIHNSDSDFWRNGRFLVYSGSQLASHKDGEHCD